VRRHFCFEVRRIRVLSRSSRATSADFEQWQKGALPVTQVHGDMHTNRREARKTRGHESFLLLPHCPSAGIRAFCVGLYLSPGKLTHTLRLSMCCPVALLRILSPSYACALFARKTRAISALFVIIQSQITEQPCRWQKKIAVCGASRLIVFTCEEHWNKSRSLNGYTRWFVPEKNSLFFPCITI